MSTKGASAVPVINGIATPRQLVKGAADILLAVAEGRDSDHGSPSVELALGSALMLIANATKLARDGES